MKASMQKLIAMGLCVVLAVGSLTGCGGSSNDAGSASGDGASLHSTRWNYRKIRSYYYCFAYFL